LKNKQRYKRPNVTGKRKNVFFISMLATLQDAARRRLPARLRLRYKWHPYQVFRAL